jgi:uncharacterized protein YjbK
MKANEAPEKIWLNQDHSVWLQDPKSTEYTEYIRKDAFIEKALKYLDENFYFKNSCYRIECGVFDSKEEMLKDFKKYMED